MGNEHVRTPAIDRIAEDGVLVPNTYSENPLCTPARGCIQTGCYAHTHGTVDNSIPLPDTQTTTAMYLRDAGYRTGYIGKWHLEGTDQPGYVPPDRRFGYEYWEGFNHGHLMHGEDFHFKGHPRFTEEGKLFWDQGDESTPDYEMNVQTDLAVEYLQRHYEDPFFLTVSWSPPHNPYEAPPEYRDLYDPDKIQLRPNVDPIPGEEIRKNLADYYLGTELTIPIGEEDLRENIAAYYGMVTWIDDQVDRLLSALENLEIAEDTIVCFTSDHGDLLGSHDLYGKDKPLEESIHIPLIFRYPGIFERSEPTDAFAGLTDLLPTFLASCGVDVPDHVHGQDLSPYLRGDGDDPPRSVYVEGKLTTESWRCLRTDEYMIAVDRDLETQHLYNMDVDPHQLNNLAGDGTVAETEERLREALIEKSFEYDDYYFQSRYRRMANIID
jgi:arylsulfatase A-like enzyme